MKIYYLQNENKEIVEDGIEKFNENCGEMERSAYRIVNGYNGALFFEDYTETDEYKAKAEAFVAEVELNNLRSRREQECFTVINRGEPWYKRLTEEEKQELETWYQAWLDVTVTKVIPNKPEWVN